MRCMSVADANDSVHSVYSKLVLIRDDRLFYFLKHVVSFSLSVDNLIREDAVSVTASLQPLL